MSQGVVKVYCLPKTAWPPTSDIINSYAAKHEVKNSLPMWAVRIAVSGLAVTPGGPGEIMSILGREESLRRMQRSLKNLE